MVRVASAKASLRMVTNLPRISVSCCLCLMHQSFADGLLSWHADSATQMLCDVEMKSPWLTHLSAQMHACKSKRSGRTQSQHILKLSQRRFHGCLAQVGAFRKLVILEHLVLRFEELPGTLRLDTTQLQGLHQGQNWLMLLLGNVEALRFPRKWIQIPTQLQHLPCTASSCHGPRPGRLPAKHVLHAARGTLLRLPGPDRCLLKVGLGEPNTYY